MMSGPIFVDTVSGAMRCACKYGKTAARRTDVNKDFIIYDFNPPKIIPFCTFRTIGKYSALNEFSAHLSQLILFMSSLLHRHCSAMELLPANSNNS